MNKIMTKEEWEASIAETFGLAVKSAYEDMIDAAVAAEREACAKVCDDQHDKARTSAGAARANACAAAIRARGEKKS